MNTTKGKLTLVLGASENASRYSNMAVKMLKAYGHPVLAIGKQKGEIDGIRIETDLSNIPNHKIDTVTLYLNPMNQVKYYDYILRLNPRRVIFNPGTENPEFEEKLMESGINMEEACTLVLLRTSQF